MILTTTDSVKNFEIGEYLDIVSSMGMYLAGSKITGGSTVSQDELYETCFEKTKDKLVKNAIKLGADAIVGMTVNYVSKDDTNDMVISINGTAVRFKNTKEWEKTRQRQAQQEGTQVEEEEVQLTEQEKQEQNFRNVCDQLTEKYNLDEKAHAVLLGFEAFQLFKKVGDVHKKVPSIDDRLEVMRILRDLESKGIIRE
ncbi:MAG: heavy metal-binding domain-containing protein, partial [Lachnospiraceae bacterium]|nr:heavy metal-binding domain-containing protein [Lachnospiraceae bacterium]